MDERDISRVGEYVEFHTYKPDRRFDRKFIAAQAYCQWADDEILKRLIDEKQRFEMPDSGDYEMSAEEVVSDFVKEMDYYQSISEDEKAKIMFGTAVEEGLSILHYIRDSK